MSAVEALDDLVAHRLHPALVNEGLRRRGRTWWSGDAASGWMLLAVARWKYNDRDRAQFTVMADIWPPGTWTVYAELNPWAASGSRPDLDDNAPLSAEPRDLRPTRYADRDWPWKIQVRPDPGLADEVVGYCLEHALPTARRLVDVDQALRSLSEQRGKWALIYACGILEHAAPGHPEFAATVAALRDEWARDPRPPDLAPILQRWLEQARR